MFFQERSQTADGPHPKNGIWGSAAFRQDAGFDVRQANRKDIHAARSLRFRPRKVCRGSECCGSSPEGVVLHLQCSSNSYRDSGTLPFSPQPPAPSPLPNPVSSNPSSRLARLVCVQCGESAFLADLYEGLRCPQCLPRSEGKRRPRMRCQLCNTVRAEPRTNCIKNSCQARFW